MVPKSLLTVQCSVKFVLPLPPGIWVPTSNSSTRRKISLTLLIIMLPKREAVGQKSMGRVCTGITEYVTVSTRAGVSLSQDDNTEIPQGGV